MKGDAHAKFKENLPSLWPQNEAAIYRAISL